MEKMKVEISEACYFVVNKMLTVLMKNMKGENTKY